MVILAEHLDERQIHPVRVSADFDFCLPASLLRHQGPPQSLARMDCRFSRRLSCRFYRVSDLDPAIVGFHQHQRTLVFHLEGRPEQGNRLPARRSVRRTARLFQAAIFSIPPDRAELSGDSTGAAIGNHANAFRAWHFPALSRTPRRRSRNPRRRWHAAVSLRPVRISL